MGCATRDVVSGLRAAAGAMAEHRDELVQLDREIGDADHGENLDRGFRAVTSKLDETECPTPAAALKLAATTLLSTVGGAAGPLYGTALLRASSAVADADELDGTMVAHAIRAANEGVVSRGKAVAGDKTMIDALTPAVGAADDAASQGADPVAVLAAAAEAAWRGAADTEPLVARKGRASYLGERSAGYVDPGARSTALLLRAFAETARSGS